jgi:hypothetical protein
MAAPALAGRYAAMVARAAPSTRPWAAPARECSTARWWCRRGGKIAWRRVNLVNCDGVLEGLVVPF